MSKSIQTADTPTPADVYEEQFVPALFAPWAAVVCAAAGVAPGQRVLDVACGTGALTCAAAERVAPGGAVVGLDVNPAMLAVARRKRTSIEWRDGRAESLPFADASFDAVVSQFGLMFFDDRVAALREMHRVLKPGGRLVVAVCDAVERSPGYAALAALLDRLFGKSVGDAFRAPFVLGDEAALLALARDAGLADARVARHDGSVRFASIDALVSTERACVWTLGGLLNDAQFERLRAESQRELAPFTAVDGSVLFSMPALIISAGDAPPAQTADRSDIDVVKNAYAAFAADDIASVLASLAQDVEWIEAQGSPYAGSYRSPPQVLESVFTRLGADWSGFDVAPAEFLVGDGAVVVLGTYRGTTRAGDRRFDAPFAHIWQLRDGRVVRFRQFTDTAAMRAAMAR